MRLNGSSSASRMKKNNPASYDGVGNSRLTPAQRAKMERLQQREAFKGDKRKVLEDVLVTKLTKKYAPQCSDASFERTIRSMVSKLIKTSGRISESDVASLEVAVKTMSLGGGGTDGKKTSGRKATLPAMKKAMEASVKEEGKNDSGLPTEVKKVNEWVLINTLNTIEHEKMEDSKARKLRLEKEQQRQWLDVQLEEKRQRQKKSKIDELTFYHSQVADLKKWQKEEEAKIVKIATTIDVIKEVRQEQLVERNTKFSEEKAKIRFEGEAEVTRCQALLKRDKLEKERKKVQERERMRLVFIENKKGEDIKAKKRAKETEYDIQLMEQYAAKLAKEEQQRADALNSKIVRQDQIQSGIAMSTHEINLKRARDDQLRAEEYQRKKEEFELKREEEKCAKRKEDTIERTKYLGFQHRLKLEKRDKERDEEQEYAQKFRSEGEQAALDKAQTAASLRRKNKAYEKLLLSQMEQQNQSKAQMFASMDLKERKLNAPILNKLVEADEQLLAKITMKLSPEKSKSNKAISSVF